MKANDNGTAKGPPRPQSGNNQSNKRFSNGPYCCFNVQSKAKEIIVAGRGGAKAYFQALQQLSASHDAHLDNAFSETSTDPSHSGVPDTDIDVQSGAPPSNSIIGADPQTTLDGILNHGPGEASRTWGRRFHQLADGRVYEELVDVSAHTCHEGHNSVSKVQSHQQPEHDNVKDEQCLHSASAQPASTSGLSTLTAHNFMHRIRLPFIRTTMSTDGKYEVWGHLVADVGYSGNSPVFDSLLGSSDGASPDAAISFGERVNNRKGGNLGPRHDHKTASELVDYWEELSDSSRKDRGFKPFVINPRSSSLHRTRIHDLDSTHFSLTGSSKQTQQPLRHVASSGEAYA